MNNDQRLKDLGITAAIQAKYEDSYVWDFNQAETNFEKARTANIGVVYGEYGLAESGGIVLFSDKEFGRSVSLLPKNRWLCYAKVQCYLVWHSLHKFCTKKPNEVKECHLV